MLDMKSIYEKMVEKADNDKNFRENLLKDAKAALKSIGIEFPEDVKVQVFEDKPDDMHVLLPQK